MTFGILTLATRHDYKKAIGLALSVRASNPGTPIAVACAPKLRTTLSAYFDHVVEEDPTLRGFRHKVHLDKYSPFDDTLFFDSDVLVFRNVAEKVREWANQPYTACGIHASDGYSSFGLDRKRVLEKIDKESLVVIDGAGHAYFRKPGCFAVFDLAREITAKHAEYAGNIPYADEDVIDITMTILGLSPAPHGDFFSRYCTAVPGTMEMDATRARCEFVAAHTGSPMRPYMMHFAANEAPFPYARQLNALLKGAGASTDGIFREAFADFFDREIKTPLYKRLKGFNKR